MSFTDRRQAVTQVAVNNPVASISVASVIATLGVLGYLGLNPVTWIIETSAPYELQRVEIELLKADNELLMRAAEHANHISENQNDIITILFNKGYIDFAQATKMLHKETHRGD